MKRLKVSLISTVLNEANSVKEFMESILSQTFLPEEFIIVDGGSTDGTYQILKNYAKKHKWIKVFQVKGASIGKGRNFAIEKARNEIIACTDAGCILDRKWLEEITKPFQKNKGIDVVVGIYEPYYTNDFEHFQGLIVVPKPEKIFMNPTRMSSRSIAFKKSIWEKIRGYPDLSIGEDTAFNIKLMKTGCKFHFVKNAVVYWKMRKSWMEFMKQFYKYGVGDRKTKNILRMKRNLVFVLGFWTYVFLMVFSAFSSPKFFIILFIIPFIYFLGYGIKLAIKSKKISGVFYGFILTLIKRLAYVLGVSFGK